MKLAHHTHNEKPVRFGRIDKPRFTARNRPSHLVGMIDASKFLPRPHENGSAVHIVVRLKKGEAPVRCAATYWLSYPQPPKKVDDKGRIIASKPNTTEKRGRFYTVDADGNTRVFDASDVQCWKPAH